jgi:putative Mg2+ transporter-C (MgtC) family protein
MPPLADLTVAWGAGLWMVLNMCGALLLGWTIGYERYFSGRAAGSQVYCLVCVTSCAIALLAGYPALWYWGSIHQAGDADPTRVIGAILTGIGFLGAGIIVKSGLNVRGLTTAASIWGTSAIGILVGTGFYLPAVGLTALFVLSTAIVPKVEHWLPSQSAMAATLRFREGYRPQPERIHRLVVEGGFSIPSDSISIIYSGGQFELRCLIFASSVARATAMSKIVADLVEIADVESFTVEHSSRA